MFIDVQPIICPADINADGIDQSCVSTIGDSKNSQHVDLLLTCREGPRVLGFYIAGRDLSAWVSDRNSRYRWFAAQRFYVHKNCFKENRKDTKVVYTITWTYDICAFDASTRYDYLKMFIRLVV